MKIRHVCANNIYVYYKAASTHSRVEAALYFTIGYSSETIFVALRFSTINIIKASAAVIVVASTM